MSAAEATIPATERARDHAPERRATSVTQPCPLRWMVAALSIALPLASTRVGAAPRKAKPATSTSAQAKPAKGPKSKLKPVKPAPTASASTNVKKSAAAPATSSASPAPPAPPDGSPVDDDDDDETVAPPVVRPSAAGEAGEAGAAGAAGSAAPGAGKSDASPALDGTELTGSAGVDLGERDSIGVELDVNSRFLYRGLALSEGPVVQPSVWAKRWGFTGAVVANVLLNDEPPLRRVTHVTPALTWAHTWGALTVEPGVLYYYSSNTGDGPQTTAEVALDVAYAVGDGFRIALTNHVDVRTIAGAYYATLGPEYEYADEDAGWTIRTGLGLAFANAKLNEEYFGVARSAFDLVEARLAVQHDLSDVFYFVLHTEATLLLPSSLRSQVVAATLVNGGAALGFAL